MKKFISIVLVTLFVIISFVSCDKYRKSTNDKPANTSVTEDSTSKEPTVQEESQTTDEEDAFIAGTPTPTNEVTPIPTESTTEPIKPIILMNPPVDYYNSNQITGSNATPLNLKLSNSTQNNIIDDENWFLNNNLNLNSFYIENAFHLGEGVLPEEIDKTWGDFILTSAFYDDSYIYAVYGADYSEGYLLNIYDASTYNKLYSLDFSNYRYAPEFISEDYGFVQQKINWGVLQDNLLYVSNSHNTYAKSSKHMNGYITAIDLSSNNIIWRSKSLVSNSKNFQIIDDVIISGYGFTAEDDFLYEIDKNTGEVLKEIPLKSAPNYVIRKDNVLYIRTYDTDYEFLMEE